MKPNYCNRLYFGYSVSGWQEHSIFTQKPLATTSSEPFFPVFSPGLPTPQPPASTQKPSAEHLTHERADSDTHPNRTELLFTINASQSQQTKQLDSVSTKHEPKDVTSKDQDAQVSVVPFPLPPNANATTKDIDVNICPQLKEHSNISQTPVHDQFKDEQLQEEEKLLLAKITLMSGDHSPAAGPWTMKRLIPDPCDSDFDTIEQDFTEQHSTTPEFETMQEISLTEGQEQEPNEMKVDV